MPTIIVHRKGYIREDGIHVKPTTFKVKDKGEPGKTSLSERWYNPKVHTGWNKNSPASARRKSMLHAHKGDKLASGRALTALANVTTDKKTKLLARSDSKYFYDLHRKEK